MIATVTLTILNKDIPVFYIRVFLITVVLTRADSNMAVHVYWCAQHNLESCIHVYFILRSYRYLTSVQQIWIFMVEIHLTMYYILL